MPRSRVSDARPSATATPATRGDWLVRRTGPWLLVDLGREHRTVGWTILGGGFARAHTVAWLGVRNADLPVDVDAVEHVETALREADLDIRQPVFVTSSNLDAFIDVSAEVGDVAARCIATVGMSNAGRVGSNLGVTVAKSVGTINLLCAVSRPLTDLALLEALSIVTEARTTAVLEARIETSTMEGQGFATGTGTDCCVVASPVFDEDREGLAYAGLHTAVGEAIGRATLDAVARGVAAWREAVARQPR